MTDTPDVTTSLAATVFGATRVDDLCIVLLHSLTLSRRTWDEAGAVLGREYRTFALDIPGHGDSPRDQRFLTIPGIADLVGVFLDKHGVTSAVVVGNSMGATVGVALANQRPGLIRGLVLVGAAVWDSEPERRDWLTERGSLFFGTDGRVNEPTPESDEMVFGSFNECRYQRTLADHRSAADAIEPSLWALYSYDVADGLSTIDQPVMAVFGSNDPYRDRSISVLRKRVRMLTEAIVDGGSHVLPVDKPAEVAALVLDWMASAVKGHG